MIAPIVGVRAAELGQRGARAAPNLRAVDAEDPCEVVVALATLEQQLEHGALVSAERHETRKRRGAV